MGGTRRTRRCIVALLWTPPALRLLPRPARLAGPTGLGISPTGGQGSPAMHQEAAVPVASPVAATPPAAPPVHSAVRTAVCAAAALAGWLLGEQPLARGAFVVAYAAGGFGPTLTALDTLRHG